MKRLLVHLFAVAVAFWLPAPVFAADVTGEPALGQDSEEEDEDSTPDDVVIENAVPAPEEFPSQELSAETLQDFLLAEIAAARSQFDLSAKTFIALARKTRDPRIAHRAAFIATQSKDTALMAEAARLWVEVAPESRDARQFLEYVELGHSPALDRAQQMLTNVLAQEPAKLPANLLELNRALARVDNRDAVRKVIYRLTEPYLKYPEAYFARAQAAAAAQHAMEALGALDRALALRPNWLPALMLKTHLLVEAGAGAQASQMLREALVREPGSRELRIALARSLIASNQLAAARTEFSVLLAAAPDDRDLLYTVGILSAEIGDGATAESLLKKVLAMGHPQADFIRLQLGKIASDRGEYAVARKWFDAVTPGGYSVEARVRSAQCLAKEGKLEQARKLLQTAPNPDARRRYLLAESQILAEGGRLPQAFELIDRELRAHPDDGDLLYESALLADRTGRYDVMELRLRKLIALNPDHAHAYNALGYSLADRNIRLDEAEALIARALELLPGDAFVLDSMGWIRFRRDDLKGALDRIEQAYSTRADPEIAAHLGEVLWRMNRLEDARRILSRALVAHPANASLKKTMRRLFPEKKR